MSDPGALRKKFLSQRGAMSPAERERLSGEIVTRFIDSLKKSHLKLQGIHVGLFRPIPGEVILDSLESFLHGAGAVLHYPRLSEGDPRKMEFVAVDLKPESWKTGPYGIEQPHDHLPAIDPARLDLVLVPGVVFGTGGERVGMGKGYFDRFLPQATRALRVGLAYDFQLVDKLPQNSWDQPVHWILTEKREIKLPASRLESR